MDYQYKVFTDMGLVSYVAPTEFSYCYTGCWGYTSIALIPQVVVILKIDY